MNSTSVSIVIPCFNEEGNLREAHRRVTDAVGRAGIQYEIVYVDDGSRDLTPELLRQL
jgi:glycosyltransferase involved in cell wall biosynthesis